MGLRTAHTHEGLCHIWTCDVEGCDDRLPQEGGTPPPGWIVVMDLQGGCLCVCAKHGAHAAREHALEVKSSVPPVTLDDYQQKAARTLLESADVVWNVLGLVGEAGEVAEYLKKTLYHQHPEDREKLKKELGDVLWYVAAIATKLGLSLGDIALANLAKLEKRYPDGYSHEASLARVDDRREP